MQIMIGDLNAILLGEKSENLYLFIHGKSGNKEEAISFYETIQKKNVQVLSYDLPGHGERNDIQGFNPWNVCKELQKIMEYCEKYWKHISLRANSIGAYFSMLSFQNKKIEKALFVSPMVDMEKLINKMMIWAKVDLETLEEKKTISTDFGEELSIVYLDYVKTHPIDWKIPTYVLYGTKDNLVSLEEMNDFVNKTEAKLTVLEGGRHWFHSDYELEVLHHFEKTNC